MLDLFCMTCEDFYLSKRIKQLWGSASSVTLSECGRQLRECLYTLVCFLSWSVSRSGHRWRCPLWPYEESLGLTCSLTNCTFSPDPHSQWDQSSLCTEVMVCPALKKALKTGIPLCVLIHTVNRQSWPLQQEEGYWELAPIIIGLFWGKRARITLSRGREETFPEDNFIAQRMRFHSEGGQVSFKYQLCLRCFS